MLRTNLMRSAAVVCLLVVSGATVALGGEKAESQTPPAVGDKALDFTLNDLDGKGVSLSEVLQSGPAVVVVLRGYPGYQCMFCTKQFGEMLGSAEKFADAKATVIFVYPGPASDLDKYAQEFVAGKKFPANFRFVIDPDFKFTNLYGLRWNAPKETAYASSFVVDSQGTIRLAKVSRSHGDRASSEELLGELSKLAN